MFHFQLPLDLLDADFPSNHYDDFSPSSSSPPSSPSYSPAVWPFYDANSDQKQEEDENKHKPLSDDWDNGWKGGKYYGNVFDQKQEEKKHKTYDDEWEERKRSYHTKASDGQWVPRPEPDSDIPYVPPLPFPDAYEGRDEYKVTARQPVHIPLHIRLPRPIPQHLAAAPQALPPLYTLPGGESLNPVSFNKTEQREEEKHRSDKSMIGKPRNRTTPEQLAALEAAFGRNRTLEAQDIAILLIELESLGFSWTQQRLLKWFNNRRSAERDREGKEKAKKEQRSQTKKKTNDREHAILCRVFDETPCPDPSALEALQVQLSWDRARVVQWFTNRRKKTLKRKKR